MVSILPTDLPLVLCYKFLKLLVLLLQIVTASQFLTMLEVQTQAKRAEEA